MFSPYRLIRIFSIVILTCVANSQVRAQIILKDSISDYWVTTTNIDTLHAISTRSIGEIQYKEFVPLKKNSVPLVTKESPVWIKFDVLNNSSIDNWFVEFPDAHNAEISFFELRGDSLVNIGSGGANIPFKKRAIRHKNFVYLLNLPKDKTTTFYAFFKSNNRSSFVFSLRTVDYLVNYSLIEYFVLGFFYGILLLIIIYACSVFYKLKRQEFLFFAMYIFTLMVYTLREDMIGYHVFWSRFPSVNLILEYVSQPLLVIGYVLYINSYLKSLTQGKEVSKLVFIISFLGASLLFFKDYFAEPLNELFLLIPHLLGVFLLVVLKVNFKKHLYFYVGLMITLVGLINFASVRLGLWLAITENFYVLYVGVFLQAILFALASINKWRKSESEKLEATQKYVIELEEKEKLKEKVNRELEQKVQERTEAYHKKNEELKLTNEELSMVKAQLEEMNVALDKSNWELQKRVKTEQSARIHSNHVSFKEFQELYSTDENCLKFLADLKWSKGFECRKCAHNNFSKISKPFHRKCTKCKSIESPTAETLFSGIRFPILKAFYIVYDRVENKQQKTIENLCEELDLSKNTCWAFRKKVDEIIEQNPEYSNWNQLILKQG